MARAEREREAAAMQFRTPRLLRALRRRERPRRLVDCEACGRDFVVPVSWIDLDAERWWIRIRCGECGATREVVVDDQTARRYEADVDAGVRELARRLPRAERTRRDRVPRRTVCPRS
jgi:transcription elongation factor Elf1